MNVPLCLQCNFLPATPGHFQCPSCYAASKPVCEQCKSRPTNPGYTLCQTCFSSKPSSKPKEIKLKNVKPKERQGWTRNPTRPRPAAGFQHPDPRQWLRQSTQNPPWVTVNRQPFGATPGVYPEIAFRPQPRQPHTNHLAARGTLPWQPFQYPAEFDPFHPSPPFYPPWAVHAWPFTPVKGHQPQSHEDPSVFHNLAMKDRPTSSRCVACQQVDALSGEMMCSSCCATFGPLLDADLPTQTQTQTPPPKKSNVQKQEFQQAQTLPERRWQSPLEHSSTDKRTFHPDTQPQCHTPAPAPYFQLWAASPLNIHDASRSPSPDSDGSGGLSPCMSDFSEALHAASPPERSDSPPAGPSGSARDGAESEGGCKTDKQRGPVVKPAINDAIGFDLVGQLFAGPLPFS